MPPRREPEPEPEDTVEEELATLEELVQLQEKVSDLTERLNKLEGGSTKPEAKLVVRNEALVRLGDEAKYSPTLRLVYEALTGESE